MGTDIDVPAIGDCYLRKEDQRCTTTPAPAYEPD
jgi:hypothetical protein